MPTEYRQIPLAPLYEISKDGDIQKISNQSMILPYPLKSNNVKLLVDGERKSFLIDKLVKEVWDNVVTMASEEEENGEGVINTHTTSVASEKLQKENSASINPDNILMDRIMKLNCKMSIKIWKLHDAGFDKDQIKKIVKHPYSVSVAATIERYKKNSKLVERASAIK